MSRSGSSVATPPRGAEAPAERRPPPPHRPFERQAAAILLAVAALASFALFLAWDSRLTFIADDWELLVIRHGWGASYFLDAFHGNVVVAPAFVYRVMRDVFGMGSATPFYAVALATFVVSGVLLFLYLRRRVGDWPALFAAVLILFLGAAFEDLLFAFQIGYFGSVAAGLGMLLALDREDDHGDRIACILLFVSLAFSSVGLAFAAGAVADLAFGRRPWRRRAYVALLPLALYAVWWLGWGRGEAGASAGNIPGAPRFVFQAAGAGITSLLGLATGDGSEPSQPHLIYGELILAAGLIVLAWQLVRQRRVSRGLAIALATGLALWLATALNRNADRLPTSSRYQYPSAVFLLLIAAEMLRGVRVPRWVIAPAAVAVALAVSGGLSLMHRQYEERWIPYADSLRSDLGAVEIAGPSADPAFQVAVSPNATTSARNYLSVVGAHGSPAYGPGELAARPDSERSAADVVLAQAEGLGLGAPAPGASTVACQTLRASKDGGTGITLLHGGFTLDNRADRDVEVSLSRFSSGLPVSLGPLPSGQKAALTIPVDGSGRPWTLGLFGEGPVRLCTTAGA